MVYYGLFLIKIRWRIVHESISSKLRKEVVAYILTKSKVGRILLKISFNKGFFGKRKLLSEKTARIQTVLPTRCQIVLKGLKLEV